MMHPTELGSSQAQFDKGRRKGEIISMRQNNTMSFIFVLFWGLVRGCFWVFFLFLFLKFFHKATFYPIILVFIFTSHKNHGRQGL